MDSFELLTVTFTNLEEGSTTAIDLMFSSAASTSSSLSSSSIPEHPVSFPVDKERVDNGTLHGGNCIIA
ncbi:hypothetical protein PM082_021301 [Marasmius tenuissimus]|nr:hypothetical protein PM082_021301 [Marasmius tenuissimus]